MDDPLFTHLFGEATPRPRSPVTPAAQPQGEGCPDEERLDERWALAALRHAQPELDEEGPERRIAV